MKKSLLLIYLLISLMATGNLQAQVINKIIDSEAISIIPRPLSLHQLAGKFTINQATVIRVDKNNPELKKLGNILSAHIRNLTGHPVPVKEGIASMSNVIILTTTGAPDSLGKEGYKLVAKPGKIIIRALKPQGLFYGLQTIDQLLTDKETFKILKRASIPAVDITDRPRFEWRGMMLDVGRYFYSVDFIKKYIDYLAMHKMNTFHWHLTEDHGWRIEIKKYPRLTQVGAWREGTQFDRFANQIDMNPHGGYYRQDQVKDIVAYAQSHYITIVPEIELPGHSLAALVAYPELSCTGGPFKMPLQWGIQKDIYCAGNEQTFKFLEDVLTEVTALFPGNTIHIGGDEAPKDHWKTCPKCQARIKELGLKDEHELQSYFIKRIESFLATKNKRIIGWDEILEGGLAPNAAVMSWRGIKGGVAAAKMQHDVVMTPTDYTYFDFYQGEPYLEPVAIGGLLTLEKAYSYEPVPAALSASEAKYIKGVQGNIWSEYIHSPLKVEYMAFPRAAALAEVAWTQPGLKNWDDFKKRMERQYVRYADVGINYSRTAYNPRQMVNIDTTAGKATIAFKTDSYLPEIRYTLDGSEPTAGSVKFQTPITVKMPLTVKAATFKNGKQISQVSVRAVALPVNQ